MKRLVALVVFAFLLGCCSLPTSAPPPVTTKSSLAPMGRTYTFHVDTAFSPYGIELIRRACNKWEMYSNGLVKFELVQDLDDGDFNAFAAMVKTMPTIVAVSSMASVIVEFEANNQCPNCRTLGLTVQSDTPLVFLVVDRLGDARDFYEVILHELGHALGLRHVTDNDAVMFAQHQTPGASCLHKADMEEFCRAQFCSLSDVKWCE